MAGVQVQLQGSEAMKKMFKELSDDTFKKKVLDSLLRKSVTPLVKAARANAPTAKHDVTQYAPKSEGGGEWGVIAKGTLKKSITKWKSRRDRSPHILVGPRKGRKRKHNGWFAMMVEYGNAHRPAHPFMGPAWVATKSQIEDNIEKDASAVMQKFKTKYGLK